MLTFLDGDMGRLFNKFGKDFKEQNMKEKLPKMSEDEIFELLSSNGNMVKRPFLLGKSFGTTGFKEDIWEKLL